MLIFHKKNYLLYYQTQISKSSHVMNQTQTIRTAINIFILVAVGVSLFQELANINNKQAVQSVPASDGQPVPVPQITGPKIQGIRIQSSDSFQAPIKQLLAKKQLNVDIVQYEFQGNDYWMNMLANWGHMALIFYFMTKHKSQTDAGKKKQIMIMGAIAVVGWFYLSPKIKPQRFAIQVKGRKVYERDYFIEEEVANAFDEYEFQIEDMDESAKVETTGEKVEKDDAWKGVQQPIFSGQNPSSEQETSEEIF